MATHYVSDFNGKRDKDSTQEPAEVPASPVEGDPEAKVIAAPEKSTPKKSAVKVETKG